MSRKFKYKHGSPRQTRHFSLLDRTHKRCNALNRILWSKDIFVEKMIFSATG